MSSAAGSAWVDCDCTDGSVCLECCIDLAIGAEQIPSLFMEFVRSQSRIDEQQLIQLLNIAINQLPVENCEYSFSFLHAIAHGACLVNFAKVMPDHLIERYQTLALNHVEAVIDYYQHSLSELEVS